MRDYTILRLCVPTVLENELRQALYRHPCLGLEYNREGDELRVRAYFESTFPISALREDLAGRLPNLRWDGETSIRIPIEVGVRDFHEISLLDETIALRGGSAFGSGRHLSTQLAARLLNAVDLHGKTVLDVGAGSGILSILAKKLGAAAVVAVEILPEAREIAAQNFLDNGCGDISMDSHLSNRSDRYDIVVANILAPTLAALRLPMLRRLREGGVLLLSGILAEEREEILREFQPGCIQEELRESEWLALALSGFNPVPNESASEP